MCRYLNLNPASKLGAAAEGSDRFEADEVTGLNIEFEMDGGPGPDAMRKSISRGV